MMITGKYGITTVQIVRLPNARDLPFPHYATPGSAAVDLYCANEGVIHPGRMAVIDCGIQVSIPPGYAGWITPRSSLSKKGLLIPNSPGLVDSDYRGEVKVIVYNLTEEHVLIERGMRLAQMAIIPVSRVQWQPVDSLDETERGEGGLGSTGVK